MTSLTQKDYKEPLTLIMSTEGVEDVVHTLVGFFITSEDYGFATQKEIKFAKGKDITCYTMKVIDAEGKLVYFMDWGNQDAISMGADEFAQIEMPEWEKPDVNFLEGTGLSLNEDD